MSTVFLDVMIKFNFIKEYLSSNSLLNGVLVLGGGAAASQLVLIIASPFLTRLYSASDFGVVAVFGSMLTVLGVLSSCCYELVIPIAENNEEAVYAGILAFLLTLLASILTCFLVLFFRSRFAEMLQIPQMENYLWLLPIGLFFLGLFQIFYYRAIREKSFLTIARTRFFQSFFLVFVQIVGAAMGEVTLLLGQVIGHAVGASLLGLKAAKESCWQPFKFFRMVQWSKVLRVASRYRHFPYFSTWGSLLNNVGTQLPPVLFAMFFGPGVAGIYALSQRIVSLPMSLIGQAVSNVFLSQAAEAKREGNLAGLVANVHNQLAQIAIFPTLTLALFGPDLFVWVFGAEWMEAGVFARIMTPMLYFQFVLSPISILFNVLEKQKEGMHLQAAMLVTRCAALFTGGYFGSVKIAVFLFSLCSSGCYIAFTLKLLAMTGNRWTLIMKSTAQSLILAGEVFLIFSAIYYFLIS